MKRFWEAVEVEAGEGGYEIRLDGRPVRTPARANLTVPSEALAQAIAKEWRDLEGDVDPGFMPLSVSSVTSRGAWRPGISAVVMTMSAALARSAISADCRCL